MDNLVQIVARFGLFCLLVGYWTAFIKYVRIIANTRGFHHLPYELYFICSGAMFAIVGCFIYSRVTRTIDSFNEHISNYILFNNRQQPNRLKYYQQRQQQPIFSSNNVNNNNRPIIITHDDNP
ncbi:hypothetical protein BLA29_011721 [Euroglyphus maynei]|uniref:Uncharacterized protein n=1 Tax=Euroglyphus maynei TaxID=6958 RepID=A0A1Y3BSI7_EURMA|nr:hypothetical protein BLA29_011721 [Euroglyphus maynei]